MLHTVATYITHGNASLFGVFVRDFGNLVTALLVKLGNRDAQQRAFHDRIEPEVRLSDGALHGACLAAVPHLHSNQPRLRHIDGGKLIERHRIAVSYHSDWVEQACAGAAGAQAAELLLQHADGATHPPLDLLKVEASHVALPAPGFHSGERIRAHFALPRLPSRHLSWSRSHSPATLKPSRL